MSGETQDELLRRLERETRAEPVASSWSRLATALSRAGRAGEAHTAAVRAVSLDASDPARELLVPSWTRPGGGETRGSVKWPGLRRLAPCRTLDRAPWPDASSTIVDLGGGRIVFVTRVDMHAVDLVSGELAWTSRRGGGQVFGLFGDRLVVRTRGPDALSLRHLEPATGDEDGPTLLLGGMSDEAAWLDERTVITMTYLPHPRELGDEPPIALGIHDVEDGARVGRIELPASTERKWFIASAGTILVYCNASETAWTAYDRAGRRLWGERAELMDVLGSLDGRLLVDRASNSGALVQALDPSTGEVVTAASVAARGRLCCASRDVLVLADESETLALDRRTLERKWERPEIFAAVATADSIMAILNTERHPVVALDPTTGVELSRVDLPEESPGYGYAAAALIGGRLVILGMGPLLVIEEAYE